MTPSKTTAGSAQTIIWLFPILLLDQLGAEIADCLHHAIEGRAHLGLELPVLGVALVEQAFGHGDARVVAGQRDTKLGALQLEIGAQAEVAADDTAAHRADDDQRLQQMAEIDVGAEMWVHHGVQPDRSAAGGFRALRCRIIRHSVPVKVQARSASVASGDAGATMVSTSPPAKVVAVAIVKLGP